MQLSKHFALSEFIRSDKARELDNPNTPDNERQMSNLKRLAATMEEVRALFGVPIDISSGYRNAVVNKAVGGVPNSDHAQGDACDFLPRGVTVAEAVARIRASGIKFDQLIDEQRKPGSAGWVHLSVSDRMRGQVMRARPNSAGKMLYTHI